MFDSLRGSGYAFWSFKYLIAKTGKIPEHDMFNTFNMGVGMMVCVAQEDADKAVRILNEAGENAYVLGELVASDEGVILK